MTIIKKTTLCAMMIMASSAFAASQIDTIYDNCVAKSDATTLSITNCTTTAIKAWDKVLNSNYKKVMAQSNKKQKAALKASQRTWLKFRDSEMKFLKASATGGTIDTLVADSTYLRMEKERAELLGSYIN